MSKEEFLKELNKKLKRLTNNNRKIELAKYENIDTSNLNPDIEAQKIYDTYKNNIKFLEAINILIEALQSKDKKKLKNILLFFLYLFILIIIIKMPFIYVRDMIINLFNNFFQNDTNYVIWSLLIELLYAITSIIVAIRLIKNKAYELTKNAE